MISPGAVIWYVVMWLYIISMMTICSLDSCTTYMHCGLKVTIVDHNAECIAGFFGDKAYDDKLRTLVHILNVKWYVRTS